MIVVLRQIVIGSGTLNYGNFIRVNWAHRLIKAGVDDGARLADLHPLPIIVDVEASEKGITM